MNLQQDKEDQKRKNVDPRRQWKTTELEAGWRHEEVEHLDKKTEGNL